MATEGIEGFYVGTRNYGATAAFWGSLGWKAVFETGHGSGQFEHPNGGPWVFIDENVEGPETHPVLQVADAASFSPGRDLDYIQPFTPEHWGTTMAMVRDPDGRIVSLQAPVPDGVAAPDADAHHTEKYGE
jgi:hypothetical protein